MKSILTVFAMILFSATSYSQEFKSDYDKAAQEFLAQKCHVLSIQSENATRVVLPVALGYEDTIYTVNYTVKWFFDGAHPISDVPLTLKIVERAEGDMFVFAGESNSEVCDFSNLPTYHE